MLMAGMAIPSDLHTGMILLITLTLKTLQQPVFLQITF
jgi:hypothetical protein